MGNAPHLLPGSAQGPGATLATLHGPGALPELPPTAQSPCPRHTAASSLCPTGKSCPAWEGQPVGARRGRGGCGAGSLPHPPAASAQQHRPKRSQQPPAAPESCSLVWRKPDGRSADKESRRAASRDGPVQSPPTQPPSHWSPPHSFPSKTNPTSDERVPLSAVRPDPGRGRLNRRSKTPKPETMRASPPPPHRHTESLFSQVASRRGKSGPAHLLRTNTALPAPHHLPRVPTCLSPTSRHTLTVPLMLSTRPWYSAEPGSRRLLENAMARTSSQGTRSKGAAGGGEAHRETVLRGEHQHHPHMQARPSKLLPGRDSRAEPGCGWEVKGCGGRGPLSRPRLQQLAGKACQASVGCSQKPWGGPADEAPPPAFAPSYARPTKLRLPVTPAAATTPPAAPSPAAQVPKGRWAPPD